MGFSPAPSTWLLENAGRRRQPSRRGGQVSLSLVLAIVGAKMLAHTWLKGILGPNFNLYLLLVVLSILALGVLASWLHRPAEEEGLDRELSS